MDSIQKSPEEKLHSLYKFGICPGLERIEELLTRLGNPEQSGMAFIHIAGTNGKGSTAAMTERILREAGFHTGLFTSPHLNDHRERYRVDGVNMSKENFAALFDEVWQAIENMKKAGLDSPTEFEAVTALALLYFSRSKVDVAVMECGMGGRLDSTNVIPAGLDIITNIGMDHMSVLGNSITKIALEKAGIIKPGATVLTAADGESLEIIEERAEKNNARLITLGRELTCTPVSSDMTGSCFNVRTNNHFYWELCIPLAGTHQINNAALAVQAAELFGCTEKSIRSGLASVEWPGRLELISRKPLIVLDGAHNEPGMIILANAVREFWSGRRICCLLGMLADKQREESLSHLLPLLEEAIITPPPFNNRAGDWQQLAQICRKSGVPSRLVEDNNEALSLALSRVGSGNCDMLLVTGSLYLLADIRAGLLKILNKEQC